MKSVATKEAKKIILLEWQKWKGNLLSLNCLSPVLLYHHIFFSIFCIQFKMAITANKEKTMKNKIEKEEEKAVAVHERMSEK